MSEAGHLSCVTGSEIKFLCRRLSNKEVLSVHNLLRMSFTHQLSHTPPSKVRDDFLKILNSCSGIAFPLNISFLPATRKDPLLGGEEAEILGAQGGGRLTIRQQEQGLQLQAFTSLYTGFSTWQPFAWQRGLKSSPSRSFWKQC